MSAGYRDESDAQLAGSGRTPVAARMSPPRGHLHHRRADVDSGQVQRPPGQRLGQLAGAAPDLQHGAATPDRGIRQDSIDNLGGIALAGSVIQLRHGVEKGTPLLPDPALLLRLGGHDYSLAQALRPDEPAASTASGQSTPLPPAARLGAAPALAFVAWRTAGCTRGRPRCDGCDARNSMLASWQSSGHQLCRGQAIRLGSPIQMRSQMSSSVRRVIRPHLRDHPHGSTLDRAWPAPVPGKQQVRTKGGG